ncbi:RUB1, partial [Symbiodinium necroappetens]
MEGRLGYPSGALFPILLWTPEENAQAAFRFSLSLIAKILVRAVTEGSTLVMRAINTNQEAALKKAISIAPRGRRAMELLNISVGTQSISPLFWSIESGSLNSARAMLVDLLTIRADRDVYYYGCDAMFTRHPDLILRLCSDASTLLWTLFDGLVWRSRLVQNGQRRVNYYIKHLVQDVEGNFSPALKWLAHHKDPRLVSHGVVVTFADLLWNRLASFQFLLGRGYFLFTLIVFITSQSLLIPGEESLGKNIATFVCRCFLYLGSMSKLVFDHCKTFCGALKAGDYHWYWILPVPTYLHSTQQVGGLLLVLLLILMYVQEPVLWCIAFGDNGPTAIPLSATCDEANDVRTSYSMCSCLAMMMYWALLMDFTLLSMRISAFVLVCGNVLADVGLFSLALLFLILAFATSISSLNHRLAEFDGVGPWLTGLLQMTLGMFPPAKYGDFRSEIAVLVAVSVFVAVISIFLVNLLVAQLNQSYRDIFEDMQGFARLNRASVTSDIIDQMSRKKWSKFL